MPPQLLRDHAQWLVWRFESKPGDKKPRKVPYYVDGGRRHGGQGTDEDRRHLVTYTEAVQTKERGKFEGIGFAFLPGDGLIGIDLDKVIDLETGEIAERAVNIIRALDSYTELSPSRSGVHIFVTTAETGPFKSFKNNSAGVEVFCGAQFFTFTDNPYAGTTMEIRPLGEENLRRLRATVRAKKPSRSAVAARSSPPADDEQRRADAALAYVDADEYQTWIDIGHALKHSFGEAAFSIWDRWSQKSAKYPGAEEARKKWATLNPNGSLKLGTVFELAKRGGWSPPRIPKKFQGAEGPAGPPGDDGADPGAGDPGDRRPKIQWKAGELPAVVEAAEAALLESGLRIYQRSGFLIRVVKRDMPSVRNYKRPAGSLGIITVDAPYLTEAFTRAARWEKWNARAEKWQRCNAPEQAAATYISRSGHWKLPRLWSAISAPTLRPDGTVLQVPGYDADTQSWYDPCGIKFPKIPESPTREDADASLEQLKAAFKTFPFESDADRSVALALALTALVRRSLPSAPLGAITAPIMASGKTLLADAISILATGVSSPAMKYADSDEEATKTMLAVLAEGDQVVLIDNVERPLEGDTLCAVLTSESYRQRVLGRTEMMSVPTTTLFLATGNHLVIAGDLRTRTLLCRIDPKTEYPEERQFDVELREWTTQHRPELVAAGLTILRAFIATGQQVQDYCKTWGRFERWSDMVRAPLIWLGCEDPCKTLKDLEKEDPERVELARVIDVWIKQFGPESATARDAIAAGQRGRESPPGLAGIEAELDLVLRDICKDRDGSLNPRRLGHWLRQHADRLVGGKRFVRAGEKDHTLLWKVEAMN